MLALDKYAPPCVLDKTPELLRVVVTPPVIRRLFERVTCPVILRVADVILFVVILEGEIRVKGFVFGPFVVN
jgi:hypothetical protein